MKLFKICCLGISFIALQIGFLDSSQAMFKRAGKLPDSEEHRPASLPAPSKKGDALEYKKPTGSPSALPKFSKGKLPERAEHLPASTSHSKSSKTASASKSKKPAAVPSSPSGASDKPSSSKKPSSLPSMAPAQSAFSSPSGGALEFDDERQMYFYRTDGSLRGGGSKQPIVKNASVIVFLLGSKARAASPADLSHSSLDLSGNGAGSAGSASQTDPSEDSFGMVEGSANPSSASHSSSDSVSGGKKRKAPDDGKDSGSAVDKEKDGKKLKLDLNVKNEMGEKDKDRDKGKKKGKGKKAKKPAQASGPEKILAPVDRRTKVSDYSKYPWCVHGRMEMTFGNRVYIGSGVLVGKNMVLTAGHNVYDFKLGPADDIVFYPASGVGASVVYQSGSEKTSMSPKYCIEQNKDWDMALVHLEKPLGGPLGYYGICHMPDSELESFKKHKKLSLTGYPGDKDGGQAMYTMDGHINSFTLETFLYDIDTAGGQSGSGVWCQMEDSDLTSCVCTGVHARKEPSKAAAKGNIGIRITSEWFEQLQKWMGYSEKDSDKDDKKEKDKDRA